MADRQGVADAAVTQGLPVAPSLGPTLESIRGPGRLVLVTPRVLLISLVAIPVGIASGLVAQGLMGLIGLITNLSFYAKRPTSWSGKTLDACPSFRTGRPGR